MNVDEVIKRFCELQAKVQEHLGYDNAADCFCQRSGFWGADGYGGTFEEGYRNDGAALSFIEKAVQEKIDDNKNNQ